MLAFGLRPMIEVSTGPLSQRTSRQEIQACEELGLTTESQSLNNILKLPDIPGPGM
jgi:hypothetical protein